MLIRSQDKNILVNFNTAVRIYANGADKKVIEVTYATTDGRFCLYDKLGKYSTEEKAIKVLDMIQDKYENVKYENAHGDSDCGEYASFQMPQDEEVTV